MHLPLRAEQKGWYAMTPLVRRSIAALASTAFMTFALAGALPLNALNAAQDAGTAKPKVQAPRKRTAKKAEGASKARKAAPAPEEEGDEEEARPKAKGRQAPPDPSRRLPNYFSGLNLTEDQREAIFEIQGKYHPQIQELQKKADDLRERQKSEVEDVLTAAQKRQLTAARKAAADRRKAGSTAKDGD
jgi:hypothetical protein